MLFTLKSLLILLQQVNFIRRGIIYIIQKSLMGVYLSEPVTKKNIQMKRFQNCFATTCQMQGWRKHMQDAIICQQLSKGVEIYGVFDGHGGPQVATYVSRVLPKQLLNEPYFKQKLYGKALTNTFKRVDQMIKSSKGEEQLRKIHYQLKLPQIPPNQFISYQAGCTANVVLLTKDKIIVANIGDSRSVLCKKGQAITLSSDHKPENASEKKRINNAGGYIKNGRVNGGVNLSRAFGDFQYKSVTSKKYDEQPIISVPDIKQIYRSKQDTFLVIGCDGIWERFGQDNQRMINYIKEMRVKNQDKKQFIENFVQSLLGKDAKQPYGLDNMSVIFLDFV